MSLRRSDRAPSPRTLVDVFRATVAAHPDAVALDSGTEQLTYLELAEAGLPRRAMRMTVVIDEKGEGHAVLTLITDRGDLVLDNKTNAILPWHKTGYVFIKRESQDAVAWVSLGGVTSPVTTANR